MARWSGPAGPGASRTLRAVRRAEAQTRQAAERERDRRWAAARIKPGTAKYAKPAPLSEAELDALLLAALRAGGVTAHSVRGGEWR